jgi:hypothetical protein
VIISRATFEVGSGGTLQCQRTLWYRFNTRILQSGSSMYLLTQKGTGTRVEDQSLCQDTTSPPVTMTQSLVRTSDSVFDGRKSTSLVFQWYFISFSSNKTYNGIKPLYIDVNSPFQVPVTIVFLDHSLRGIYISSRLISQNK